MRQREETTVMQRLEAGHGLEELEESVRLRPVQIVVGQVHGAEDGAAGKVADAVEGLELVARQLRGGCAVGRDRRRLASGCVLHCDTMRKVMRLQDMPLGAPAMEICRPGKSMRRCLGQTRIKEHQRGTRLEVLEIRQVVEALNVGDAVVGQVERVERRHVLLREAGRDE